MRRANSFAVHTTAEGSAGWASHVWECLRTAVRASHSLHGRRLPISATRMRISTRGLVFRQCHNFSSISFNRLSLSVLYITASAVQFSRKCSTKRLTQLQTPGILPKMWSKQTSRGPHAERNLHQCLKTSEMRHSRRNRTAQRSQNNQPEALTQYSFCVRVSKALRQVVAPAINFAFQISQAALLILPKPQIEYP